MCVVYDGSRVGIGHAFHRAVTPADTYAGDTVLRCTDDVKGGVAHHESTVQCADLREEVSDDFFFRATGLVQRCTGNAVKAGGQSKMSKDFFSRDLRLGGSHKQPAVVFFQHVQQFRNAGINETFKLAHHSIAAAIDGYGFVCLLRCAAKALERIAQGRADKGSHFSRTGDGQVEMPQSQFGALEDTLTGIHQCAVQIEKNVGILHGNLLSGNMLSFFIPCRGEVVKCGGDDGFFQKFT